MKDTNRSFSADKVLFWVVIINICIGLFIFQDYGISIDELRDQRTAETSLKVYLNPRNTEPLNKLPVSKYYGISQSMIFNLFSKFFSSFLNVDYSSARHYSYYLTFQYGIIAFYYLAKRFVPPWHAFVGTLLLMTQPFFWGHAFINSKDIPLFSIFLLAIVTGFNMVDRFEDKIGSIHRNFIEGIHKKYPYVMEKYNTKKKYIFVISSLLLITLIFHTQISSVIYNLITHIYYMPENPLMDKLLSLIFENRYSISAEAYAQKAAVLFDNNYIYAIIIALFLVVFLIFPKIILLLSKYVYSVLKMPHLWIASITWGICMSTRIIGFVAGGMVGLYYLLKIKKRPLLPLFLYTIIASIVLYLSWPFLWHYGIPGLIKSLFILTDFPWDGEILFNGKIIGLPLPRVYIPTLMIIKYTIPFLLLAFFGLCISLINTKIIEDKAQFFIILCWFFIPLCVILAFNVTIYKSRQLMFITPPLFLLASIALSYVSNLVNKRWIYIIIIIITLAPGIFSIISLHSYQYIYYNGIVGGIKGASRNYELDYWLTSSKDAAFYINNNAPYGAKVGGPNTALPYLRKDIKYFLPEGENYSFREKVNYVILPTKGNTDIRFYTDAEDVYEVLINGVRLTVIRELNNER